MKDFALRVFEELLSYYPVVVPTLLVFSLECASSLKVWCAVQRIPFSKPVLEAGVKDEHALKWKARTRKAALIFSFVLIIMFALALVAIPVLLADATKVKIFYFCMLFVPLAFAVTMTLMTLSGAAVRVVLRDAEGKPSLVTKKVKGRSRASTISFKVIGALASAVALWFGYPSSILVVYMGLFYSITAFTIYRTKQVFRYSIVLAGIMGVFTVALSITLIVTGLLSDTKPETLVIFAKGSDVLVDWKIILISVGYSLLSFSILAMCYRFDYANFLPPDFQVPVSEKTTGFCIPSSGRRATSAAFPRPYFSTAFVVFHLSYVALAVLSAGGIIECTIENVAANMLYIAPPAMVMAILMLAVVKGQLGKLWRYEEDWSAIPSVREGYGIPDVVTLLKEFEKDELDEEKGLISLDAVHGDQAV